MKKSMKKSIVTILLILLANVVVWGQSSCPPPTGLNATTTSNSATLTWTGSMSTYYVEYHALTSHSWEFNEINTNTITLTGLCPSTTYEALVYGECEDGFSDTASIVFKCACGTVSSLPYFDGFEISSTNCWSTVGDGWEDGCDWVLTTGNNYNPAYEGDKYYYSKASTSVPSVPNTYLISPAIHVPANADGVNLSWYGRKRGDEVNKYRVVVSTATSSTDDLGTTLVTVTNEGSTWTEHSVSLDNYAGQTIYIAFWHFSSNYSGGVCIDNVNINQIMEPTAEIIGPSMVDINQTATFNVNLITGSSEELYYTWSNARADALYGATDSAQFNISYPSFGYDTITVVVDNNYGLDTCTFVVYARDLTPVNTFPYSTGFEEGEDLNWNSAGGTHGWYIGEATASTGSHSIYVSHDGGVTNSYVVIDDASSFTFAYRPFEFTSGDYTLGFDWKAHGGFGDNGIVMLTDDISVFQGDVRPNANSYTQLCEGLDDEWNSWTRREEVFHIDNPGVYYIAFFWLVDGMHGNDNAFAVDNIFIDRVSCSAVSNLTIDDITPTSLSYSWTPNSGEQSWLVTFDNNAPITVSDTFYVATDLEIATSYDFSVSALCVSGDTSDAVTVTGVTGCVIIDSLPYSEDFENYEYGLTDIPCWNHLGGGEVSIGGAGMMGHSLLFTPDGNSDPFLAVMPEFGMDISGVKFTMYSMPLDNFSGRFQVGYITDPNDESTFHATLQLEVDDFLNSEDVIAYKQSTAYFTDAPSGARIALRQDPWGTNHYWLVDDILVTDTTNVDPPVPDTCNVPTGLCVLYLDTTSAIIDWTAGGDELQWELELDGTTSIVSAHPHTFSDLTPDTEYSVRVRAICDTNSYSEWTPMITFTTDTVPGDVGIEDLSTLRCEIFPNPASDNFTISIQEEATMTIFDQNGRLLAQRRLEAGNTVIDINSYASGVYFLRLDSANASLTRKLMVK